MDSKLIAEQKMRYLGLFILLCTLMVSCQENHGANDSSLENRESLYIGVGTFAPGFEENRPSFGGDAWSVPMEISVDGKKLAFIDKGGHSFYIGSQNKASVVEFSRDKDADELVYVMVFTLQADGQTNVLWKDIIKKDVNTKKVNLLSGKAVD